MAKHIVLVAGNIGAGKTALTERIGSRLGWWDRIPNQLLIIPTFQIFIATCAWAFPPPNIFPVTGPINIWRRARDLGPRSWISIYEDAHIFARALHNLGNLAERDYLSYRKLFEQVVDSLPDQIY
jgi:deoxyadenosine/deoxycytidine kinase